MRNVLPTFLLHLLFFVPLAASAQVVFTEIMYSPDGADGGREWIEVKNTGGSVVDLGGWKLFENETNHYIRVIEEGENTTIPAGGFAVIADNPASFLADWPSFFGLLLDSAFSLGNMGETLILRDSELADKDTVAYDTAWGADGDGKSLQLVGGEWVAAMPTPGEENESLAPPEPSPVVNNQSPPSVGAYIPAPVTPLFTARISEKERFAIVGAPAKFKGETVGTTEGLSGKTRFVWNFGDGGTAEGESVLHIYRYPGEYIVILNAVSGTHSPEDRATIKVIPSELSISNIGPTDDFFIELSNNSAYELNLSGWLLKSGARYFVIPENSFILPKKKIIFPQETTNLFYSAGNTVGLLYPNGLTAAVFSFSAPPEPPPASAVLKPAAVRAPAAVKTVVLPARSDETENPNPSVESTKEETLPVTAAFRPVNGENAESRGIPWPWLLGALAFVAIGGAAVVVARRGKTPADEFAITEEEGNDNA